MPHTDDIVQYLHIFSFDWAVQHSDERWLVQAYVIRPVLLNKTPLAEIYQNPAMRRVIHKRCLSSPALRAIAMRIAPLCT